MKVLLRRLSRRHSNSPSHNHSQKMRCNSDSNVTTTNPRTLERVPSNVMIPSSASIVVDEELFYEPQLIPELPSSPPKEARSLAKGTLSSEGKVHEFRPSPRSTATAAAATPNKATVGLRTGKFPTVTKSGLRNQRSSTLKGISEMISTAAKPPVVFERLRSSFLRVADLELGADTSEFSMTAASEDTTTYPNYSYASTEPPPGLEMDPQERWVALDDGEGSFAPVAPMYVRALARRGLDSIVDQAMWTPNSTTARLLAKYPDSEGKHWNECSWKKEGPCLLDTSHEATSAVAIDQQQVLVWTGSFLHGLYGSDLPAVRAAGVIDMSADDLMNLLVDSARVKEYNKLSLGRDDILVLQESKEGPFGGVTKVMQSTSRPPLVRKNLQFTSLLHARELEDGSGYNIVTRAVTAPESAQQENVMQSEILMGVNLIKRIAGEENRCLMVTVNHIRSPMVPMMIAKRIGLQAAVNFFQDLRSCC